MQDTPKNISRAAPQPDRRGRPSAGDALTAAERKALQRTRDRSERPMSEMTLEAVLSGAGRAVRAGNLAGLAVFIAEMQRRAEKMAKT